MKKSTSITLGLIMSAVIISGCGDDERCLDPNGVVVADDNCREDSSRSTSGSRVGPGYGYRWYYGGRGVSVGEKASGGSYVRSGFGKFASAHGFSGS